jgi:hypothetical protein
MRVGRMSAFDPKRTFWDWFCAPLCHGCYDMAPSRLFQHLGAIGVLDKQRRNYGLSIMLRSRALPRAVDRGEISASLGRGCFLAG